MLRERSQMQTQKTMHCVIPFLQNNQSRQFHKNRKQISGCQGQDTMGNEESLLNGYDVSFGGDKKIVPEPDSGDGCTAF